MKFVYNSKFTQAVKFYESNLYFSSGCPYDLFTGLGGIFVGWRTNCFIDI